MVMVLTFITETKGPKSTDDKAATKEKPKKAKKSKKDSHTDSSENGRGNYDSRVTIEVLDDASPDGTPRLDEDSENYRKIELQKEKLAARQASERKFRKLPFDEEKMRVVKGADTFVRTSGLSAVDIEKERQRLMRIEDSARSRAQRDGPITRASAPTAASSTRSARSPTRWASVSWASAPPPNGPTTRCR